MNAPHYTDRSSAENYPLQMKASRLQTVRGRPEVHDEQTQHSSVQHISDIWMKAILNPPPTPPLAFGCEAKGRVSCLPPGTGTEQKHRRSGERSPCSLQEQLWQHLSSFCSCFGQVGFSHGAGQGFNWFTCNSLAPAAQVHVRQCQQAKAAQTAGLPRTTSRRPL